MNANNINTEISDNRSQFFRILETISNSDVYKKDTLF